MIHLMIFIMRHKHQHIFVYIFDEVEPLKNETTTFFFWNERSTYK